MADQTGVGAPDRADQDTDADPDDEHGTADSDDGHRESAGSPNGGPATATHSSVATPARPDEPDTGVGPSDEEPSADGTPSDEVPPRDQRVAAAERHPSVSRMLGVRPRGQLRARKVQRIVRRIDPWSVLKLSLIFYFCVWIMVMVAAVLLWGVAVGSGTVSSLETVIAEFMAFEEFRFNGDQLFQIFALGGLIMVFVGTAVTAVLAVLFNLIADLTGGVRLTVVEVESARRILGSGARQQPISGGSPAS